MPKLRKKTNNSISSFYKVRLNFTRKFQHRNFIIFILAFAVVGSVILLAIHAASPTISLNPDKGAVTVPARVVNDSTASDGNAVQFGRNIDVPTKGAYFGITQENYLTLQNPTNEIPPTPSGIGRKFDTVRIFTNWNNLIATPAKNPIIYSKGGSNIFSQVVDNGSIPIISVSPDSLPDPTTTPPTLSKPPDSWKPFYDGTNDTQIYNLLSLNLQTFPGPVFFIFQHEPTTTGSIEQNTVGSSAPCGLLPPPDNSQPSIQSCDYVAAWRHIHDIFTCKINPVAPNPCKPATNVIWVWDMEETPPIAGFWTSQYADGWYPGDQYVDWLGAEDFYFACKKSTPTYNTNTFLKGATGFYGWATQTKTGSRTMPLMIPAFGTDPVFEPGGNTNLTRGSNGYLIPQYDTQAANWIWQAAQDIQNNLPQIKAVGYYSTSGTAACPAELDSNDNPAMLGAFTTMGGLPYFNQR